MNGLIFAFDIGVASVGWAVVEKNTYEILEACSNIFPEGSAAKNKDRRNFRQTKRLKRRQKTRISDFNKLWIKSGFSIPSENEIDIIDLRIKGLSERLTENEIYNVLRFMLKYRGISYLDDDIDENAKGDYARGIAINQKELLTKYPCYIQKERFEAYGNYRGNTETLIENEKVILRNVFTTSAYLKEVSAFLKCQSSNNTRITAELVEEYIKIFSRKRKYYEGPGNELSRTDYGRYTTRLDEHGRFITEKNIFEKLIGKCSVYSEELRGAAASYTAQEFNALNDLNNLTVNGRKLEKAEKEEIINHYKNDDMVSLRKILKKVIGENIDSLTGFRVDKDDKEIYHTMELYRKLRKLLTEINVDIANYSRDELDEIGKILTLNTEREGIEEAFKDSVLTLSEEEVNTFVSFRKKNGQLFSKWHSFSIKIMRELIPELYDQPVNQMVLLTNMGVFKDRVSLYKDCKELPFDSIANEIYNPVVRKSVHITIKILNALLAKYGEPDKIVIELPRDKNSDEEKEKIQKTQKDNEKELADIIKKIKQEYDIDITEDMFYHHKGLVLKLKLWNEQGGRCLYSGKTIPVDQLIKNQNLFEVDHVIPISISFDDSRNNKVLVYATENQEKGNATPFMYLSGVNREWGLDEYVSYVKSLSFKSKSKIKNLLFAEDITKIDVIKGFINRNLNDTRYASKVVLNSFQDYFRAKECDTVISVVRGSFTHQMRVNLGIKKDREEDYSHHAVDAMLMAYSQMGYDAFKAQQKQIIDFETGEILADKEWDKQDDLYRTLTYQEKWFNIIKNIEAASKKVKYWHKVDKKCNRSLCNQTIYGTREKDGNKYVIDKLDIYNRDDMKRFKKMLADGREQDFLMYTNDPKTWEDLMAVYRQYEAETNPFVAYNKETSDFVRKYAKNHNGPKIEKIKFRKEKVGSCIDISHKYGFEKESRRVILGSLKPFRTDVYINEQSGRYYLVGLKYSDIKCDNNKYVIEENAYNNILIAEKMIKQGQSRKDLASLGYRFCFSLYENDIIYYEKKGEYIKERFLSRTMPKDRNYIETKPIYASKFSKQNLVGLSKTKLIKKYKADILGNEMLVEYEKFNRVVDIIK